MKENWLLSVQSDGTERFVIPSFPKRGDEVAIRVQMYSDAPVKNVFLRYVPNGAERLVEALPVKKQNGFTTYEAKIIVNENRINYQFYLVTEDCIYFYTQNGITTYLPDHTYDFILLADYVQPSWVKSAVFYQIFPERFCSGEKGWNYEPTKYDHEHALNFYGGTLKGIEDKIPYFKELGVNAIYLNPIFAAPSTHKYDCADYYHVDPAFGGDEALASLSKALHENGMRLILDISINHTGTEHVWFKEAMNNPESVERGFYFFEEGSNEYKGWFDIKSLPVLNYQSKELRKRVFEDENSVIKKWLKPPYSIDGWRFDVADVFARNDEIQLNKELWPLIRKSIREVNPEAYIIGEDWGDCGYYLQGNDWDTPMNYFGFGRVVRQYLGAGDLFTNRNDILRNVNYKMTAKDVKARMLEHYAKIPYALQAVSYNLIDSHDVARLYHENVSKELIDGSIIWQFMMLGTPSIYYGDEASVLGWTWHDGGFRAPIPWEKQDEFMSLDRFKLYKKMAHRRLEHSSLIGGSIKIIFAEGEGFALARYDDDETHVMVMNNSKEKKEYVIEVGAAQMFSNDHIEFIVGDESKLQWLDQRTIKVTLDAEETILIYKAVC